LSTSAISGLEGPAQRSVFRDQVVDRIREAIVDGRIPLGQPLRERQVAAQLDISRAPIREALLSLEKEGLVVTTPHRGTFVASYTDQDVTEIYTLRAALEQLAVGLIDGRASAADFRALDDLVTQMDRHAADGNFRLLIAADHEFHRRMCALSGHRRLLEAWEELAQQALALFTVTDVPDLLGRLYGYVEETGDRHRPIVTALRDGDVAGLGKYLSNHILEVPRLIIDQRAARDQASI
jgi:DNA-binding GntR family transcriptional regulator